MIRALKFLFIIILLPVIILLIFVPVQILPASPEGGGKRPLIIAHRGASGIAPENTLPAIDSALAAGVDYIEIDVHLSSDGEVIVIHDETLDRTTNGQGKVSERSLEYIRSLDAGSWFSGEYRGTVVPTLEEVMRHIHGKTRLLIEIKKKGKGNEGIEEKVSGLIRSLDAADWCVVQSFNDKVLERMHQLAPQITLHKLIVFKYRFMPYVFDGKVTRFSMKKYAYVEAINMHYRFFSKKFSEQVHREGKLMFLWGCRAQEPCFQPGSLDCEGIITDFPGELKLRMSQ